MLDVGRIPGSYPHQAWDTAREVSWIQRSRDAGRTLRPAAPTQEGKK